MKSKTPPTGPMIGFMQRLAGERVIPELGSDAASRIEELNRRLAAGLDKWTAMALIDAWKNAPRDAAEADTKVVLDAGVYEVNGEVFVVKWNKAHTNMYAKKLVEISGHRLNENDDHVQIDFEYAPGAIRRIKPQHRMPLERAKELIVRYGRCINCGRTLKAAKSVEAGIGPVCIQRFA